MRHKRQSPPPHPPLPYLNMVRSTLVLSGTSMWYSPALVKANVHHLTSVRGSIISLENDILGCSHDWGMRHVSKFAFVHVRLGKLVFPLKFFFSSGLHLVPLRPSLSKFFTLGGHESYPIIQLTSSSAFLGTMSDILCFKKKRTQGVSTCCRQAILV